LDICGYAIIAIMWIEDWFLLEMRNNKQETSTNTGE
jgi:predicted outer membrane lipoprotein